MQKKLLLSFMILHCVTVQAHGDDSDINNEKDYTEYTQKQRDAYQKALVDVLAGNDKAIDEEDQKNKQMNEEEEKESRRKQYDGQPGYWATEPSINSEIGRRYYEYAQHKQAKNKIDQDYSKDIRQKKDLFNKEVLPVLVREVQVRHFRVDDRLAVLRDCGADIDCYKQEGFSSRIFKDPDFGSKYEHRLYMKAVKIALAQGILLTCDEMQTIFMGNPETKNFVQEMQNKLSKTSMEPSNVADSV